MMAGCAAMRSSVVSHNRTGSLTRNWCIAERRKGAGAACLVLAGEGALGALDLAAQLGARADVVADVHAVLPLHDLHEVLHDAVVEVLASQVRVARRGDDLAQQQAKTSAPERRAQDNTDHMGSQSQQRVS